MKGLDAHDVYLLRDCLTYHEGADQVTYEERVAINRLVARALMRADPVIHSDGYTHIAYLTTPLGRLLLTVYDGAQ